MAVSVRNLHKSFHAVPVLRGVDLCVEKGGLTVILGPSGCGKSTLLRCLNGLEKPDQGRVEVTGRVGMVFQGFHLFPHLSVLENLCLAPRVVDRLSHREARLRAMDLLARVGLSSHAHHYPSQLSGGQQQRAAIARSLAMSPQVICFDEPTSALDPGLAGEVLEAMRSLQAEGMTLLVVTHDLRYARRCAGHVAYMEEGRIVESAPSRKFFARPAHAGARRFLSHGR